MNRSYNTETISKVGEEVLLKGWVHVRRNMGKIAFLDMRDRSGIVQVVLVPAELDEVSVSLMEKIRPEFVLALTGIVQKRGEKQINSEMETGTVEVLAKHIEIINEAKTPPFEIDNEEKQVNEDLRLRYRYLDLRKRRMLKNLIGRHKIVQFIREYLDKLGF